jgi:hypothetical protein
MTEKTVNFVADQKPQNGQLQVAAVMDAGEFSSYLMQSIFDAPRVERKIANLTLEQQTQWHELKNELKQVERFLLFAIANNLPLPRGCEVSTRAGSYTIEKMKYEHIKKEGGDTVIILFKISRNNLYL